MNSTTKRDLVLQQMGISQWQLCHPERLKGAVNICLASHIQLVILSDEAISLRDPYLQDILRAVELNKNDCAIAQFTQLEYLQLAEPTNFLLFEKNNAIFDRGLAKLKVKNCIYSAPFSQLKQDPQAKRQLWQALQVLAS